ncbi:MAG: hypothetical protein VB934_17460, partial [Polyangiaceae bacterium]
MSTTDDIQLPGGMSFVDADRMAKAIVPSWVELFGSSTATREPGASPRIADAKPASASPYASAAPAHGTPVQPTIPETPNTTGVSSQAEASIALPTSSLPWGKILGGLAAAGLVIGVAFAATTGGDSDEEPAADSEAIAPAAKVDAPKAPVRAAVAPKTADAAHEEKADRDSEDDTAKADTPDSAEPADSEPPAEPEKEPEAVAEAPKPPPAEVPKASPPPKAAPKPVAVAPKPRPRPRPKTR